MDTPCIAELSAIVNCNAMLEQEQREKSAKELIIRINNTLRENAKRQITNAIVYVNDNILNNIVLKHYRDRGYNISFKEEDGTYTISYNMYVKVYAIIASKGLHKHTVRICSTREKAEEMIQGPKTNWKYTIVEEKASNLDSDYLSVIDKKPDDFPYRDLIEKDTAKTTKFPHLDI